MKATTKRAKSGKRAKSIKVPEDVKRTAGHIARDAGRVVFVMLNAGVYTYGFELPAGKTAKFVHALCNCNGCNPPTPTRRMQAVAA